MEPCMRGIFKNGIDTQMFYYKSGLCKVITNDTNTNKVTVETFKNEADQLAGKAFKTKHLTYSPILGWLGTTSYREPAQKICYDIKDGVVKGAHLDTMRPDISRPLKFADKVYASDIRQVLNWIIKHVK